MILNVKLGYVLADHFKSASPGQGFLIRDILLVGALRQPEQSERLETLDEKYLADAFTLLEPNGFRIAPHIKIRICNPLYGSNFLTDEMPPADLVGICNVDVVPPNKDIELQWHYALVRTNAKAAFNARTTGMAELRTTMLRLPPYRKVAAAPLFCGCLDVLKRF